MRRQLPVYSPLSLAAILSAEEGAILRSDDEVSALASEVASRFNADQVFLMGSGTQALQSALSSISSLRSPLTVALPGYSCYDLVTSAVGAGVHVRFYDLDPDTLTPDLDSLRSVLSLGVSAVVAGNLHGYPLEWQALSRECALAGVPLIEDASQGLGTRTHGGSGGTLGDATILSFGRGKGWTGGGGGALLVRDGRFEVSEPKVGPESGFIASMRHLAVDLATWLLGRPALYLLPTSIPTLGLGVTEYKDPIHPHRIPPISAALARRTAKEAFNCIPERRGRARRILEVLSDEAPTRLRVRTCLPVGGLDNASFLRLPLIARTSSVALELREQGRDHGVASGYPRPLHRLPQVQPALLGGPPTLPGSDELAQRLVTIPTHRWVRMSDIDAMRDLLLART